MSKVFANDRLREWIDNSGTSYPQLAADLKISIPHLSRLVTGARRPSLHLAVRIAARTGIPTVAWTQAAEGVTA